MIKKEPAIVNPRRTLQPEIRANNKTLRIRGIERRPTWQKCRMARHYALTYFLIYYSLQSWDRNTIISYFMMRKQNLREVKYLTQSHKMNKQKSLPIPWSGVCVTRYYLNRKILRMLMTWLAFTTQEYFQAFNPV